MAGHHGHRSAANPDHSTSHVEVIALQHVKVTDLDPRGIDRQPARGTGLDPREIDRQPARGTGRDPREIDRQPARGTDRDPRGIGHAVMATSL